MKNIFCGEVIEAKYEEGKWMNKEVNYYTLWCELMEINQSSVE